MMLISWFIRSQFSPYNIKSVNVSYSNYTHMDAFAHTAHFDSQLCVGVANHSSTPQLLSNENSIAFSSSAHSF